MNKLIKLVIDYQKTFQNEIYEEIIKLLNPVIEIALQSVPIFYKDDIRQEILLNIYQVIKKYQLRDNSNKYMTNFIKQYQQNPLLSKMTDKELKLEYYLFCNENQLKKYISKTIKTKIIDYLRKYNNNYIHLNIKMTDKTELLDYIQDRPKYKFDLNTLCLNCDERFLLDLLINKFTEKQIGNILGITQQAVNKRKKKLLKKIKNS